MREKFTKIVKRDKKRKAQYKEVFYQNIFITSHFLPKKVQPRERRKKSAMQISMLRWMYCVFSSYVKKF